MSSGVDFCLLTFPTLGGFIEWGVGKAWAAVGQLDTSLVLGGPFGGGCRFGGGTLVGICRFLGAFVAWMGGSGVSCWLNFFIRSWKFWLLLLILGGFWGFGGSSLSKSGCSRLILGVIFLALEEVARPL